VSRHRAGQGLGHLADDAAERELLTRLGDRVHVTGRLDAKEYESNGMKVRGFELIASDVSVSLRRQQATVKKTTPSYSNQQGNGYSPNTQYTTDPYTTGAPF